MLSLTLAVSAVILSQQLANQDEDPAQDDGDPIQQANEGIYGGTCPEQDEKVICQRDLDLDLLPDVQDDLGCVDPTLGNISSYGSGRRLQCNGENASYLECEIYDACAPLVDKGASCSNGNYAYPAEEEISQFSNGEPDRGEFVGCEVLRDEDDLVIGSTGKNCFCDESGQVECYDDRNNDSCGLTAVTVTPRPSSTPSPTPSPTSSEVTPTEIVPSSTVEPSPTNLPSATAEPTNTIAPTVTTVATSTPTFTTTPNPSVLTTPTNATIVVDTTTPAPTVLPATAIESSRPLQKILTGLAIISGGLTLFVAGFHNSYRKIFKLFRSKPFSERLD